MDFGKIREEQKEIIDLVACCPLSMNDLVDAMEAGDCFCLGL
jgi:hypothetical protein